MDAPYHVDEYSYTRNDAFYDDKDASFVLPMRPTSLTTSQRPVQSREGVVPQLLTGDYASSSATTSHTPNDGRTTDCSNTTTYRRPHRRPRSQRPVVLFERQVQQQELEARQREANSPSPRRYDSDDFEWPINHAPHERRESKFQLEPTKPKSFYAVQPYHSDDDYELERRQYYGQLRTNSIYKQRIEEVEVNWTFDCILDQIMVGWTLLRVVLVVGFIVHVVQVLRDEAAERERWGGKTFGA